MHAAKTKHAPHTHTLVKEQGQAREDEGREKGNKATRLPLHKCLFVWASASAAKLDDSVFDGTRCTTIKETEELTAGQIRALNLSICLGAAHRAGREPSERRRLWRRDFSEADRLLVWGGETKGAPDNRAPPGEEQHPLRRRSGRANRGPKSTVVYLFFLRMCFIPPHIKPFGPAGRHTH